MLCSEGQRAKRLREEESVRGGWRWTSSVINIVCLVERREHAHPDGEHNTYKSSWILRGCNFVFNCIFGRRFNSLVLSLDRRLSSEQRRCLNRCCPTVLVLSRPKRNYERFGICHSFWLLVRMTPSLERVWLTHFQWAICGIYMNAHEHAHRK